MTRLLKAASRSIRALLSNVEPLAQDEYRLRNDRLSYFSITRQLVEAQFVLRDGELSARLWHEVADRDMDLGRVVNLLYRCTDHVNDDIMRLSDESYLALIDPSDP